MNSSNLKQFIVSKISTNCIVLVNLEASRGQNQLKPGRSARLLLQHFAALILSRPKYVQARTEAQVFLGPERIQRRAQRYSLLVTVEMQLMLQIKHLIFLNNSTRITTAIAGKCTKCCTDTLQPNQLSKRKKQMSKQINQSKHFVILMQ
ncbi:Hypothetical_protein [Hexamita inflata]|uniref:Hypothetical_protein n=1 Tax=Hexamita inflata TaxID=28002 RepID=A0ABP1H414_9EUKA